MWTYKIQLSSAVRTVGVEAACVGAQRSVTTGLCWITINAKPVCIQCHTGRLCDTEDSNARFHYCMEDRQACRKRKGASHKQGVEKDAIIIKSIHEQYCNVVKMNENQATQNKSTAPSCG